MSDEYDYGATKPRLFTPEGVKALLHVRDNALAMLKHAGAFKVACAMQDVPGDSFLQYASIDFMAELGEISRVYNAGELDHDVYIRGDGNGVG